MTPRRPTAEDKGYLSVSEDDAVPNTASADDSVVKPSGLQLQAQPLTTPSSASADGFDTEVEVRPTPQKPEAIFLSRKATR